MKHMGATSVENDPLLFYSCLDGDTLKSELGVSPKPIAWEFDPRSTTITYCKFRFQLHCCLDVYFKLFNGNYFF